MSYILFFIFLYFIFKIFKPLFKVLFVLFISRYNKEILQSLLNNFAKNSFYYKENGQKSREYDFNHVNQFKKNTLSQEEAREILGVGQNPSREEITKSFKRLMLINHPDKGGSQYIASKIIEAKELLLKNK